MIKKVIVLFFIPVYVFALNIPQSGLSESLVEKKQGYNFLGAIWNTGLIVDDIEAQNYLKKLGFELAQYSKRADKHFAFFLLKDTSINAFAGPYGYIGMHTATVLRSESEAELAGVLAHEIAHVTQNHLKRFDKKTSKQSYLVLAGILASALVSDSETSEAITASTLAGVTQQSINFTREHEWEADREGISMLVKAGFDPKGMAYFFEKLQDNPNAKEFLQTHPLSINRMSESLQRASREPKGDRLDSFAYLTVKAKLYYQQYGRTKLTKNAALTDYMKAYQAFDQQLYKQAETSINRLLKSNQTRASTILAGRIAAKLGKIEDAKKYFNQNNPNKSDEPSTYYLAQAYLDNQQVNSGIAVLKKFLRKHSGSSQSYQLLAQLYIKSGHIVRSHINSAQALALQGDFSKAIQLYGRAKALTHNQDLYDVMTVKINQLQQVLDLYKELP